jgi:ribonuclease HI
LKQSKVELNKLRAENAKLKSDLEKIVEGLAEDGKEEQLAEQLMKAKKENKALTDEISRLAKELNQLQKEALERKTQQPGGKSLADELNEESMQSEIDRLKQ